jgi:hypothetical protein
MSSPLLNDDNDDEEFMRSIVWEEEDRSKFTSVPWSGGYRWFRSPNVVPLEQYRQARQQRQRRE